MKEAVCTYEKSSDELSESTDLMELFLDFEPMRLFFCLNFSSQLRFVALTLYSVFPVVVAKNRAFSSIRESVSGNPFFCCARAQFDSARSMSGNLPLDLLMGERLPSSWYNHFSLFLNTLDTVLDHVSELSHVATALFTFSRRQTLLHYALALVVSLGAENSPPISVCLVVGCSS